MFAFCRQFAERTESSSSSTERQRFSLSFSASSSRGASTGSSVSSKLMKMDELLLEDLRGERDGVVRA